MTGLFVRSGGSFVLLTPIVNRFYTYLLIPAVACDLRKQRAKGARE
jgi:hypothetical protein